MKVLGLWVFHFWLGAMAHFVIIGLWQVILHQWIVDKSWYGTPAPFAMICLPGVPLIAWFWVRTFKTKPWGYKLIPELFQ